MEAPARLWMMNYQGKCNTYLVLPSWTEMKICTGSKVVKRKVCNCILQLFFLFVVPCIRETECSLMDLTHSCVSHSWMQQNINRDKPSTEVSVPFVQCNIAETVYFTAVILLKHNETKDWHWRWRWQEKGMGFLETTQLFFLDMCCY